MMGCFNWNIKMSTERKARRQKWWKEKLEKDRKSTKNDRCKAPIPHKNSRGVRLKELATSRGFRSRINHVELECDPVSSIPDIDISSKNPVTSRPPDDQLSDDSLSLDSDAVTMKHSTSTTTPPVKKLSTCSTPTISTKPTVKRTKTKKRYILFLGNLSPASSREDIHTHFKKRGVVIKELRLLTYKDSGKSRGCAFAEFDNDRIFQNALKFHRSKLNGKTINVEVTCGGGGKSTPRMSKIMNKNRKQRLARAKNRNFD